MSPAPGTPPSPQRPAGTLAFWAYTAVIAAVTVSGLYFGRPLLIPLATAGLLFVLLTSVIDRIAATRIAGRLVPVWLAHMLGISIVLAGLAIIIRILGGQAQEVAAAVPRYEERLATLLAQLVAVIGEDAAAALQEALEGADITGLALGTVSSAGSVLSGLMMILLYLPFMFAERHPMRRKLAIAAPDPEIGGGISSTIQHISISLQRYVGIKTFVSALTGALCYAVMKALGLDFAETWGVLTFALNFIPTIGSAIAVVLPAIVALVQFDTLTPFLVIAAGCGAVQFVVGNIIEPALTGKSLNLSPMMVIVALTCWTTLWGLAGAFLSVPITVCVMIIFAHVPGLRWAAILMSGDGTLNTSRAATAPPPAAQPQDGGGTAKSSDPVFASSRDVQDELARLRADMEQSRRD